MKLVGGDDGVLQQDTSYNALSRAKYSDPNIIETESGRVVATDGEGIGGFGDDEGVPIEGGDDWPGNESDTGVDDGSDTGRGPAPDETINIDDGAFGEGSAEPDSRDNDDSGKSFAELKDEYESDDAEWAEEAGGEFDDLGFDDTDDDGGFGEPSSADGDDDDPFGDDPVDEVGSGFGGEDTAEDPASEGESDDESIPDDELFDEVIEDAGDDEGADSDTSDNREDTVEIDATDTEVGPGADAPDNTADDGGDEVDFDGESGGDGEGSPSSPSDLADAVGERDAAEVRDRRTGPEEGGEEPGPAGGEDSEDGEEAGDNGDEDSLEDAIGRQRAAMDHAGYTLPGADPQSWTGTLESLNGEVRTTAAQVDELQADIETTVETYWEDDGLEDVAGRLYGTPATPAAMARGRAGDADSMTALVTGFMQEVLSGSDAFGYADDFEWELDLPAHTPIDGLEEAYSDARGEDVSLDTVAQAYSVAVELEQADVATEVMTTAGIVRELVEDGVHEMDTRIADVVSEYDGPDPVLESQAETLDQLGSVVQSVTDGFHKALSSGKLWNAQERTIELDEEPEYIETQDVVTHDGSHVRQNREQLATMAEGATDIVDTAADAAYDGGLLDVLDDSMQRWSQTFESERGLAQLIDTANWGGGDISTLRALNDNFQEANSRIDSVASALQPFAEEYEGATETSEEGYLALQTVEEGLRYMQEQTARIRDAVEAGRDAGGTDYGDERVMEEHERHLPDQLLAEFETMSGVTTDYQANTTFGEPEDMVMLETGGAGVNVIYDKAAGKAEVEYRDPDEGVTEHDEQVYARAEQLVQPDIEAGYFQSHRDMIENVWDTIGRPEV